MSDSETYYALYDIYNQLIPRVLHVLCSPIMDSINTAMNPPVLTIM